MVDHKVWIAANAMSNPTSRFISVDAFLKRMFDGSVLGAIGNGGGSEKIS